MVGGLKGGGKAKKDLVNEILNMTEDFSSTNLFRFNIDELEKLQSLLVGNLFRAPRGVKTRDVGVSATSTYVTRGVNTSDLMSEAGRE
eukprot:5004313-Heterocapsa_arctica.AAC.1